MINVLITAGGTTENIDTVRSITNNATGRLGSIIADKFADHASVTYVCGENAIIPNSQHIEIIRIKNVSDLICELEKLLKQRKYDAVIHSMAVSDFTPQAFLSVDEMVESLFDIFIDNNMNDNHIKNKIRDTIFSSFNPLTDKKISSNSKDVVLLLKQTEKAISYIKNLQPQTILVGFKLLSAVSEDELLNVGLKLLNKNDCDFVVANDLSNIQKDLHKAILINKDGILKTANTKQEIANAIFELVAERVGNL